MNDFRHNLEQSRDFLRWLSEHDRRTSYLEFAMAAGMAALGGAGLYIAFESDPLPGALVAGFGVVAAKKIGEISMTSLRASKQNALRAQELQEEIDKLNATSNDNIEPNVQN